MNVNRRQSIGLGLALLGGAATFITSRYLFDYAFKRINYVPPTSADKQKYANRYFKAVDWYKGQPREDWRLPVKEGALVATYLPAHTPTTKTVVIAHGYRGNAETMAPYAQMFHSLGYNVLMPDDRAHGRSAGQYVGFGWLDRLDYLRWLKLLLKKHGPAAEIALFGVSMGGATVCMLAGEDLPAQVKCIVSDCAYTDVKDELIYLLKRQFHLPGYPFYPLVSKINARKNGYSLDDASAVDQLKKNTRPILFIHGASDEFVPTRMVLENFRATQAKKQLWVVDKAGHAESFWLDEEAYKKRVGGFISHYFD